MRNWHHPGLSIASCLQIGYPFSLFLGNAECRINPKVVYKMRSIQDNNPLIKKSQQSSEYFVFPTTFAYWRERKFYERRIQKLKEEPSLSRLNSPKVLKY